MTEIYFLSELKKELQAGSKFTLPSGKKVNHSLVHKLLGSGETRCSCCGLEATYLQVKKVYHFNQTFYELNCYGTSQAGNPMIFTADHIYPKSKGGPDDLSNLQLMCIKCNQAKKDVVEREKQTVSYFDLEQIQGTLHQYVKTKLVPQRQAKIQTAFKKLVATRVKEYGHKHIHKAEFEKVIWPQFVEATNVQAYIIKDFRVNTVYTCE